VLLLSVIAGLGAAAPPAGGSSSDPYCTGSFGSAAPSAGSPLRFGVDPGIAGSAGGVQLPSTADDPAKDLAGVKALGPPGRQLVVRLNRLFWSDGQSGINAFQHRWRATRARDSKSSCRSATTRPPARRATSPGDQRVLGARVIAVRGVRGELEVDLVGDRHRHHLLVQPPRLELQRTGHARCSDVLLRRPAARRLHAQALVRRLPEPDRGARS
jgi:hypothetical protein